LAWHAAQLRPDRFRAVIGLSVPFRARGSARPTTLMPQTDAAIWYQLYFQEPGVAEAEYDRNARVVFHAVPAWSAISRIAPVIFRQGCGATWSARAALNLAGLSGPIAVE